MPRKPFPEIGDIVISALACVVRGVERHAKIKTQHHKLKVVAQAGAGVQRNLLGKGVEFELSSRTALVLFEQPHISSIYKKGTVEVAENTESVLDICFEFQRSCLVEVRVSRLLVGVIAAGAYAAHRKGSEAVGTTNIELLAVGCIIGVAVALYHPCHKASGDMVPGIYAVELSNLGCQLDELCVRVLEKVFVFLVPLLAKGGKE